MPIGTGNTDGDSPPCVQDFYEPSAPSRPIPIEKFYGEYHGHKICHLEHVLAELTAQDHDRSVIYLAGDSSLDNKYWLFYDKFGNNRLVDAEVSATAVNGYEKVLSPPFMVLDVAYWLNKLAVSDDPLHQHRQRPQKCQARYVALNTAVEESTIADRPAGVLLPQDEFIRDRITEQDVLIVSVGGNDVALRPSRATMLALASLLITPAAVLDAAPSLNPAFLHFVHLFGRDVHHYIERLVAKRKPKLVLVCMIYHPAEQTATDSGISLRPGWADRQLEMLHYNTNPQKLQMLIRKVFAHATERIKIEGTVVRAVPLFEVLDPRNPADYVERVEPSGHGARKMAQAFLDVIRREDGL